LLNGHIADAARGRTAVTRKESARDSTPPHPPPPPHPQPPNDQKKAEDETEVADAVPRSFVAGGWCGLFEKTSVEQVAAQGAPPPLPIRRTSAVVGGEHQQQQKKHE